MKKKGLITVVAVFVLAASVAAGYFTHGCWASFEARAAFKNELNDMKEENKQLEKEKRELKNSVSETERNIESKNEIAVEAEEYQTQLDALESELGEANRMLTEMDESIRKKKEYIGQADKIKNQKRGRSFTAYNKTLECDDDIQSGRYIAEGSGNLLIYNSSGTLRISENLSTIDTNSFTFDIADGESVKVTDSVTFTTLK